MDASQIVLTILGSVLGSGAVLGFVQFLIQRKDKKEEKKENDKFEELRVEFNKGLDDRETTGKNRYDEHKNAIAEMSIQHQRDFWELKKAIDKLTENDTRITDSIEKIAEKQEIMAESLVGQAHDRIIFLADKITERGAITNKEKATIKSMYEPYRKLGGNGVVQESVEYILTLPTVTEEEARELDKEK